MSTLPSESFSAVSSVPTNSVAIAPRFQSFLSNTLVSSITLLRNGEPTDTYDDDFTMCSEDSVYMMDHPEVFNYDAVVSREISLDVPPIAPPSNAAGQKPRRRIERAPQPVVLYKASQMQTAGFFSAQYEQTYSTTACRRKKANWTQPCTAPLFSVTVCSLSACQATSTNMKAQKVNRTKFVAPLAFPLAAPAEVTPSHFKKIPAASEKTILEKALEDVEQSSVPSEKTVIEVMKQNTVAKKASISFKQEDSPQVFQLPDDLVQKLANDLLRHLKNGPAGDVKTYSISDDRGYKSSPVSSTPSERSVRAKKSKNFRLRNQTLPLDIESETQEGSINAWIECMQIAEGEVHSDDRSDMANGEKSVLNMEIIERAMESAAQLPESERDSILLQLLQLCDHITDQLNESVIDELSTVDV